MYKKQQNLLFFIFRLYGGGAERTVSNLSQAFGDKYNVKIAVYDQEERTYPYAGELIRIRLPFSKNVSKNSWLARGLRLIVLVFKLRNLKRKHAIDVCISFSEQANIINLLTKRKKTIISVRTTLSEEIRSMPRMKVLYAFVRFLYNWADHIVVPSKAVLHDLMHNFKVNDKNIATIYNYMDIEKVNFLAGQPMTDLFLQSLFKQSVLLNVGRIAPQKGFWLLFHVFKRLKEKYPELKLVSIGEGDSMPEFKAVLIDYGKKLGLRIFDKSSCDYMDKIGDDVYFIGFEANPFQFMRNSHIFLFPSVFEGFPNALLEAMQAGLPVISADCPSGPREILAPDTSIMDKAVHAEMATYGVLAPVLPTADIEKDIEAALIKEWVYAVECFLEDGQLIQRYAAASRKRAKDFDKGIILEQWESLIVRS